MTITNKAVSDFKNDLYSEEKAPSTIAQYIRDITALQKSLSDAELTKEAILEYKARLKEKYSPSSVNTVIAAINSFLDHLGKPELKLKTVKVQRQTYADSGRELKKGEYMTLLAAVEDKPRLRMILQTLVSTGIRISELRFITVEALKLKRAEIDCKGKHRTVLLPGKLCKQLKRYADKLMIKSGSLFITRGGKPVDSSNLLKEMKRLAEKAKVEKKKVFPHNFRHLFARMYYSAYKDIVRLADILGHSSINTTRIYTRESGDVHRKQLERLCCVIE